MPDNLRQKLTYGAHLFKALTRQHHLGLRPLLETCIEKDAVVIDVGAHAGQFMKLFAKMAPQGHVHAFEPGSYAYSIASAVIKLHGLKNVTLHALGLSDTAAQTTLHVPIKDSGSLGFGLSHISAANDESRPSQKEEIHLTTLDQFVLDRKVSRVDFIKADIEGWEMRFLLGAEKTLQTFRPALLIEVNDEFLRRAGNTAVEMWNFLKKMNYTIYRCDEQGRTDLLEAPILKGDLWCLPSP